MKMTGFFVLFYIENDDGMKRSNLNILLFDYCEKWKLKTTINKNTKIIFYGKWQKGNRRQKQIYKKNQCQNTCWG